MGASEPAATRRPAIPVQRVVVHGEEVAYRLAGSGPVVVLLHGIAGSSDSWLAVMALLVPDHTVLAPDFLGHGRSGRPLGDYSLGNQASGVRDLLQILGIDRATMVGQSFGGGVAMQFAYQFPERCERLVLVDSGGLGREVSWLLRLAGLPAADLVLPVLFPGFARRLGDSVARLLDRVGVHNAAALEVWRTYRYLTDPGGRRAFTRTVRSVVDLGGQSVSAVSRLYLAAEMPTLIIWGERDRIIPLSHAWSAHRAIPGSRLQLIPGAGHFPHAEAPALVAETLRTFIRTTTPSTTTSERLRDLLRRPPGGATSD